MSLVPNRFTFTWQIVNFSMCPQKTESRMESPVFAVEMMGNSEWQLLFYPRGGKTDEHLSCFLTCIRFGRISKAVNIGFSLTIFADDVNKRITEKSEKVEFVKDKGLGFVDLALRRNIFGDKETYLPNDTLTIQCSIWQSEKDTTASGLDVATLPTDRKIHFMNSEESNEGGAVTRIDVVRKTISWPLRNVSSIGFNEGPAIRVSSKLKDAPSFRLTVFKSIADQSLEIEIQKEKSHSTRDTFVRCKGSVLQTPNGVEYVAEDEFLFEGTDAIWKFPSFIKLDELHQDQYLKSTSDVLYLLFELSFSNAEDVRHIEKEEFRQHGNLRNVSEPIAEFERMFKDGSMFDVIIRTGDREFKVHKNILMARSPIFGAMFNSDMKEKATGAVDINDVDPDTMDRMLAFIYSNALDDLLSEEAVKLFAAADKYQVLSLKSRCTWILASRISVKNVCEVLRLADRHGDNVLRDWAERFVQVNASEIFKSQDWADLVISNSYLAATVMHKILKNQEHCV